MTGDARVGRLGPGDDTSSLSVSIVSEAEFDVEGDFAVRGVSSFSGGGQASGSVCMLFEAV